MIDRLNPMSDVGEVQTFQVGEPGRAVNQLRKVVLLKPDLPQPLNNLAWLLATCSDDTVRNGPEAVSCAERACRLTAFRETAMVGTLAAAYAEKRARLLKILEQAGFTVYQPRGAYYIMTDISDFGFADDVAFSKYLVEKIGVAVVPGSSFYNDARDGANQVRFTFCKKESTLAAAEERLAKLHA